MKKLFVCHNLVIMVKFLTALSLVFYIETGAAPKIQFQENTVPDPPENTHSINTVLRRIWHITPEAQQTQPTPHYLLPQIQSYKQIFFECLFKCLLNVPIKDEHAREWHQKWICAAFLELIPKELKDTAIPSSMVSLMSNLLEKTNQLFAAQVIQINRDGKAMPFNKINPFDITCYITHALLRYVEDLLARNLTHDNYFPSILEECQSPFFYLKTLQNYIYTVSERIDAKLYERHKLYLQSIAIIMLFAPLVFEAWQHTKRAIAQRNWNPQVFNYRAATDRNNMFATDLQQICELIQTQIVEGPYNPANGIKHAVCQELLKSQSGKPIEQYVKLPRTEMLNQYLDEIINTILVTENTPTRALKILRAHVLLFSFFAFPDHATKANTIFGLQERVLITASHAQSFLFSLIYLSQLVIDQATLAQKEIDENVTVPLQCVDTTLQNAPEILNWLDNIQAPETGDNTCPEVQETSIRGGRIPKAIRRAREPHHTSQPTERIATPIKGPSKTVPEPKH